MRKLNSKKIAQQHQNRDFDFKNPILITPVGHFLYLLATDLGALIAVSTTSVCSTPSWPIPSASAREGVKRTTVNDILFICYLNCSFEIPVIVFFSLSFQSRHSTASSFFPTIFLPSALESFCGHKQSRQKEEFHPWCLVYEPTSLTFAPAAQSHNWGPSELVLGPHGVICFYDR